MINDRNKRKYKVTAIRAIQLSNKRYVLEAQVSRLFGLLKVWQAIGDWDSSSTDKGSRGHNTETRIARDLKDWQRYYEALAEEKTSARKVIQTTEVRTRDTHPESFI